MLTYGGGVLSCLSFSRVYKLKIRVIMVGDPKRRANDADDVWIWSPSQEELQEVTLAWTTGNHYQAVVKVCPHTLIPTTPSCMHKRIPTTPSHPTEWSSQLFIRDVFDGMIYLIILSQGSSPSDSAKRRNPAGLGGDSPPPHQVCMVGNAMHALPPHVLLDNLSDGMIYLIIYLIMYLGLHTERFG